MDDREMTDLEQAELDDAEKAQGNPVSIRFVGSVHTDYREITRREWVRAGLAEDREGLPDRVRWDRTNAYTVSRAELGFLSDGEFDQYIRSDRSFVVEGES